MSEVLSLLEGLRPKVLARAGTALRHSRYVRVSRCKGLLIEMEASTVSTGEIVYLCDGQDTPCEVVGFDEETAYLMPLVKVAHVRVGMHVRIPGRMTRTQGEGSVRAMLGRVIDGLGRPLDGGGPLPVLPSLSRQMINPMRRHPIDTQLEVGVSGIDALLSVGRGQRLGLFAGSGVGKSVLLGMLARFVAADAVVVGLVGERGREVREFVEKNLGTGLDRSIVVASPADDSAAMRLRGATLAVEMAERLRNEGAHVLLLLDSLTRVAHAQREIGLAMGEPPGARGYPPSAFAALPALVERAGNASSGGGSITAFFTVLMEEDDLQDPVVDTARAILDGHVVLSRQMAEAGIYPAIDIGSSISRVMNEIRPRMHQNDVRRFRELWQCYEENRDLIAVGAYQSGSDERIDRAISLFPALCDFIRQNEHERMPAPQADAALSALFAQPRELAAQV